MKPPFFLKRCGLKMKFVLLFLATTISLSYAQNSSNNSEDKSYVVVGAFSMQSNASRFSDRLKGQGLEVNNRLNAQRNLYYVYAYEFNNRQEAFSKAKEVRGEYPDLYDTWIYTGDFKNAYSPAIADRVAPEPTKEEEEAVEEMLKKKLEENKRAEEQQMQAKRGIDDKDEMEEADPIIEETVVEETVVEPTPVAPPKIEREEGHYYVYVNTVNGRNAKEVQGKVEIIDPVRAKRLTLEQTHDLLDISDPNNGSKTIKVSPSIFGFKPTSHVIDLSDPVNDSTSNYVSQIGDSIIVNFELERFRKGDFAVLFNVYFYKDAAIMKEESVYELNQLRDMMLENQGMKIRIHGHTNGNSFGKVLHLDDNDKDFFNLKGLEHKEAAGSAKKLSEYRAVTIKRWLMDQGIADDRMQTKGWGGKRMIAGKHDSQAHKNVRVEIEVTADE